MNVLQVFSKRNYKYIFITNTKFKILQTEIIIFLKKLTCLSPKGILTETGWGKLGTASLKTGSETPGPVAEALIPNRSLYFLLDKSRESERNLEGFCEVEKRGQFGDKESLQRVESEK